MREVTQRQIAERAGVSVITVSRCLRGDPSQALATRERIQRLAREMGYRPNPLVSALVAQRMRVRPPKHAGTIAFLDPWRLSYKKTSLNVRLFAEGARQQAEASGFTMEKFPWPDALEAQETLLRQLLHRGIHALLFLHFPKPGTRLQVCLDQFACATVGFTLENPALHRVTNNQLHAMQACLEDLFARGYQRPGFVTTVESEQRVQLQWISGWLGSMYWAGRDDPIRPLVLAHPRSSWEASFSEWMEREQPDVVLSAMSEMSGWIRNAGMSLKQVGFVNLDHSGEESAGMNQNWPAIGAAAVDLITGQLFRNERGVPASPMITQIEGSWVDGDSVRPAQSATVQP